MRALIDGRWLDVPKQQTILLPDMNSARWIGDPLKIRRFELVMEIEGWLLYEEALSVNFTERVMSHVRRTNRD